SFRTLRTNMLSTMVGKKLNSILITSVDRNEGKTTICTNLAISFALTGRKTLLIDADLRKSEHHRIFKVKRSPGISDICLKETVLKKAIRKTSVDNLFILTSGRRIPNPAEVLESEIMNDVIQQIDREFNIAIFDSPPILPVSDPMILGKKIDATFLIILADVSLIKSIDLAISSAESAGVKLKGVILNAMSYESTYGKYKYRYYYE
ncbi:MAG: capsular biosynthesis protein, partial [Candidatus Coatesbacteria bacterium]